MSEIVDLSEKKEELIPNLRRTDDDIRVAVELWRRDRAAAEAIYGHIKNWMTTAVTNMEDLFKDAREFSENISEWDVSNVTSMDSMFWCAHSFDCDIRNWETGNVTGMYGMFLNAMSFQWDISEWDVSTVDNMDRVFIGCPVNFYSFWMAPATE